ncbi:guanylate kinase, partial [Candidatus Poribacteria bacterium]|nr:guanylate kinase [Candidatus Poribacteria bacterium]
MIETRGLLIVISGPSGSGKTSITKILRNIEPKLKFSISATTRAPRAGEVDGVDYYFFSEVEFQRRIEAGEFAEWAVYGNHRYGTLKKMVEDSLQSGNDIFLEIEVQGATQLRKLYPDGVFIFILPPSQASLEERLRKR